jgi:type IV secretory pathway TraG/TraD family ATPase VirD4
MYQLVYVSDGKSRSRIALDDDVRPGETPQLSGRPLPFVLSAAALTEGFRYLAREPMRPYQSKGLHAWIGHWIYADTSPTGLFATPLYCGILALVLQLPFSVRQDIRRRKELRYGRRLKGPILVTPRQFTNAVDGDGIGITTNDDNRPLRVPRNAENKHFLVVGDTGSGKSSVIRQMLYQVADRGDSAIVYDPACEFVKQFYDERRGDIVLNPLDARMPYWNPSDELRRKAEAKARRR